LNGAEEDDVFQVRDIDAGGHEIHETTMPGFWRLRNSRMRWRGRSTRSDLGDEGVAATEYIAADLNELVGVETWGRSLAAKMRVLGKRPYFCSCWVQKSRRASMILRLESG